MTCMLIGFMRKDYVKSKRPGLDAGCFNGHKHSEYTAITKANHGGPAFDACPIVLHHNSHANSHTKSLQDVQMLTH